MKLADIFSNYFTVRKELMKAVEPLTQAQLDWMPPMHTATIGKLLAHIASCEVGWIGYFATRKYAEDAWERFEGALDKESVLRHLREAEELFTEYLVETDFEDWDEVFYSHTDENGSVEKLSRRWVVWHVVEHQARHRGQIFMLMRMQELEVPNV
jgi:uncharacterized damage-inducible protein DinB